MVPDQRNIIKTFFRAIPVSPPPLSTNRTAGNKRRTSPPNHFINMQMALKNQD
jgi:hypothetical protein